MTQNLKTETTDESPIYIEGIDVIHSVDDETANLRAELESERDGRLRLAAEYENYRRRTKREKETASDEGKRELLERLISIADDLDLAAANADRSPEALAEGLRLIDRRFRETLEANNVVPFESKGEKFDPERHEAFDVAIDTKIEPGTVHTEIRRGYFWNDRLLRPALVVVAE